MRDRSPNRATLHASVGGAVLSVFALALLLAGSISSRTAGEGPTPGTPTVVADLLATTEPALSQPGPTSGGGRIRESVEPSAFGEGSASTPLASGRPSGGTGTRHFAARPPLCILLCRWQI